LELKALRTHISKSLMAIHLMTLDTELWGGFLDEFLLVRE